MITTRLLFLFILPSLSLCAPQAQKTLRQAAITLCQYTLLYYTILQYTPTTHTPLHQPVQHGDIIKYVGYRNVKHFKLYHLLIQMLQKKNRQKKRKIVLKNDYYQHCYYHYILKKCQSKMLNQIFYINVKINNVRQIESFYMNNYIN